MLTSTVLDNFFIWCKIFRLNKNREKNIIRKFYELIAWKKLGNLISFWQQKKLNKFIFTDKFKFKDKFSKFKILEKSTL